MVLPKDPTCIHFHCAHGFATQRLADMLDSLVRVSRRVTEGHYASILSAKVPEGPPKRRAACLGPPSRIKKEAITLSEESYVPLPLIRPRKPMLACTAGNTLLEKAESNDTRLTSSASLLTISRTV